MAKCCRAWCDAEGTWRPRLLLYAYPGTVPATGYLYVALCDDCRDETAVADLVDDAGWRVIVANWPRTKKIPDRRLTALAWDPVGAETIQ